MTDANTPSEPEEATEPPASSIPLRFGEGGAASDSMPLPPPPASGETTSREEDADASMPARYHDANDSELGVETQPPGAPPLGDDPTPPWTDPPAVEVEVAEAGDAPLPPEEPTYEPPPEQPPYESSVQLRFHEGSELGVATQAPGEPPLGEDPTPAWIDPPAVEPVPVEAADPPLPEHLHRPEAMIIGRGAVLPTEAPFQEVAFDIAPFTEQQREHLYERLVESNTAVRVEATTLYSRIDDVGLVEGFLADLEGSDDIEEVIEEADDEADEIVFDLSSLSTEERRHLSMRLTGAGITHIWEVATDLVVSVEDAPMIERYVEEVRNPDGFGDEELASFEEDSDVDDEEVYAAMSNLYVAADKLMQRPGDDATAGEFYVAVDDVDGLPAPFGFDPRVWSQVQGLANKIADTLDAEGDTEVIGADARTLRQLLANYV